MTSRYRGPDRAKLRVQRVREAWVQLAAVIREEQANPLYCGPDPGEIEAIGDRATAEIDDALFRCLAQIAALPRAKTAGIRSSDRVSALRRRPELDGARRVIEMVEVSPPPANFHATPRDADSLPPAPPAEPAPAPPPPPTAPRHPMEEWVPRALPGGGTINMSEAARANFAADMERTRQLAGPPIVHASVRAAQRAEAEAERKRKAGPDPNAVLRDAHRLRAEAQAEVARLTPQLDTVRKVVFDLEARHSEQATAVQDADQAAVEKLIAAIATGNQSLPLNPKNGAVQNQTAATGSRLRIATAARDRLMADLAKAQDRLTRTGFAVARCALAVLTDQAADEANTVIKIESELRRRRAGLDRLALLLTSENRRLNHSAPLPPQISRALYPPDPVLHGTNRNLPVTNWAARYADLQRPAPDDDGGG